QWGRLRREQIERLQALGLSLSIEPDPFTLTLGGRRFEPVASSTPTAPRSAEPSGDFHLVQFKGPIRRAWLQALRNSGVAIVQPLYPYSYIVWAPADAMRTATALPAVRWSGVMQVEWKVPPGQRFTAAGPAPTMVLASAHVDPARLADQLDNFGRVDTITPLGRHYQIIRLEMDRRDYPQLAELPAIYAVQYIRPEAALRGEMSNQSIVGAIDGGGAIQPGYAAWLNAGNHDGSGITVGVIDGPILASHPDLAGRLVPCAV